MLRALTGSMPLATLASSSTDGRDLLRWTDAASGKMSDLPHARGGAAVARWELASQQLLYMYGGCSIVQCYDGLMRLDLYRGKWTTEQVKGTPPKKRKGHTLNLLGRSLDEQVLLVIGGWSGDGVVPNGIKEYSIIHNQWQYRAFQGTPPPDRWAHTATSIDPEHVIVFGGEGTTPGQYLNDVYLFSLLEGEWRRLHPQGDERFGAERLLPAGRMGHTATLIKTPTSHALYIFGGYTTAARGTRQVSAGAAHAQCPARSRMGGGGVADGGMARFGRWSACPLPVVAPLLAPYRPPLAPRSRTRRPTPHLAPLCASPRAQHRVATNELWALDLRGGLGEQQRDSPGSDYLRWVKVDTIGRPPAARGHHAAVSSSYGGNLFVAFGCDETELQCYDDAFMLDTTYPQGHYWQKLPVGMQRPAARQMLTAWVHGASLVVSGGCTPAQDAAQDHCYSDVWQLPLDGLIQGGKQLNATVHVVEEDAGLNLNLQLLPGQRSAAQATAALSGTPAAGGQSSRSSSGGGGGGGASELASNATTSAISGNATASGGGAIVMGNHTVTLHNGTEGRIVGAESLLATEEDDDAVPLYIDTSLNDGVDVLSAAVIYGTNTFEDAMCQMSNITRCPFTYVTRGHAAKEETLELEDTTKFTIGRILRINPGAPNQEDNQIVGFGERVLSETQKRLLALAAARHAADSAIEHKEPTLAHKLEESVRAKAKAVARGGGGGDGSGGAGDAADARIEAATSRIAAAASAAAASRLHPMMVHNPEAPTRRRLSTAFLQLEARASALLPSSFASSRELARKFAEGVSEGVSEGVKAAKAAKAAALRAVPMAPGAEVTIDEADDESVRAAKEAEAAARASGWSPSAGVPYEASRRVHGRALHTRIDLKVPLKFAHAADEPVVQLPASVTSMEAAPGLQHLAGERSVHRQHVGKEDTDESNPLRILALSRQSPPPPRPPSPPPSPPAPPSSPPPTDRIFIAEDIMYEYDEKEHKGHVSQAVAELAAGGSSHLSSASSKLSGLLSAVRSRTSMMHTVSAQGLVDDIKATVIGLPVWAIAASCLGAILLLIALICCCMQGAQSRGRKKAQLEDINPVFQTETWRKLE